MQKCPIDAPQKDRCRKMFAADMVAVTRCPAIGVFGIQRNQGATQMRLTRPSTMNTGRHPYRAIDMPQAYDPTAGPALMPAMMTALAMPRCCCGTCSAMILLYDGNATDSAAPSKIRTAISMAKP